MSDEIARLRALLGEATPGPWERVPTYPHRWAVDSKSGVIAALGATPADAKTIAALGTLWKPMLAAVDRLHEHWSMCTHEDHDGDPCEDCGAFDALRAAIAEHLGEP